MNKFNSNFPLIFSRNVKSNPNIVVPSLLWEFESARTRGNTKAKESCYAYAVQQTLGPPTVLVKQGTEFV